jgi:hypothetical protein
MSSKLNGTGITFSDATAQSTALNSVNGKTPTTGAINGTVVAGTAVATTSGTSVDITSIPSWVKQITLVLNGVSTTGTARVLIQLGTSGGVQTTGYTSTGYTLGAATGTSTTGLKPDDAAAPADARFGIYTLALFDTNFWVMSGCGTLLNNTYATIGAGNVTLGGTLTTLRLTTVGGTDTFDAGTINILYS